MHTLYHYTNLDAFIKILTSQKIWISDATSLNDYEEIKWGLEQIYKHTINDNLLEKNNSIHGSFYIFSLSSEPDLLSQWRAYAGDGKGVSIGFDFSHINTELKLFSITPTVIRQEVIYNQEEQRQKIIQEWGPIKKLDEESRTISFLQTIYPLAATFKNPAFKEEKEHRLILIPTKFPNETILPENISELKFREKDGAIISYFEYKISIKDVIKRIVIGPRCRATEQDIRLLLSAHSLHDVEIVTSTASYR